MKKVVRKPFYQTKLAQDFISLHPGYGIAINLAMSILCGHTFGGGMIMGYAVYRLIHLQEDLKKQKRFKQTVTDYKTLGQIFEEIDGYKNLHNIEKANLN